MDETTLNEEGRVPLRKIWIFSALGAGWLTIGFGLVLIVSVFPVKSSDDVGQPPSAAMKFLGVAVFAYLTYLIWDYGPRSYLRLAGLFPDAASRNRVIWQLSCQAAPIGLIIIAPLVLTTFGGPDWLDIVCLVCMAWLYDWSKRFRGPAVTDALTRLRSG